VDELFLLLGRFLVAGIVVVLVGGGGVRGCSAWVLGVGSAARCRWAVLVLLSSSSFCQILDRGLQKLPDAPMRPCPLLLRLGRWPSEGHTEATLRHLAMQVRAPAVDSAMDWLAVKAMAELPDGKNGVVFWGPDRFSRDSDTAYVSLCVEDGSERHFVEAHTLRPPNLQGESSRAKPMSYHERRAMQQRSKANRRGAAAWLAECWLFWVAEGSCASMQVHGEPKKALTALILQNARDRRLNKARIAQIEVECEPMESLALSTRARKLGCSQADIEVAMDRAPREKTGLIVLGPNGQGEVSLRWEDGSVTHGLQAKDLKPASPEDWVADSWESWQRTEVFRIAGTGRETCNGLYARDGEQAGRPCYTKVGSGRVTLGFAVWFDPQFGEWCLGRWNHQNSAFYRAKWDRASEDGTTGYPPATGEAMWVQVEKQRVWDPQDGKCHQKDVPPNPLPVPTLTYGSR
jgi:hypothetical protein